MGIQNGGNGDGEGRQSGRMERGEMVVQMTDWIRPCLLLSSHFISLLFAEIINDRQTEEKLGHKSSSSCTSGWKMNILFSILLRTISKHKNI